MDRAGTIERDGFAIVPDAISPEEATRDWLARVSPQGCLVPRGGVLMMEPLILHASSPAEAHGRRRVVHLEYAADPLPGGVEWFESEARDL